MPRTQTLLPRRTFRIGNLITILRHARPTTLTDSRWTTHSRTPKIHRPAPALTAYGLNGPRRGRIIETPSSRSMAMVLVISTNASTIWRLGFGQRANQANPFHGTPRRQRRGKTTHGICFWYFFAQLATKLPKNPPVGGRCFWKPLELQGLSRHLPPRRWVNFVQSCPIMSLHVDKIPGRLGRIGLLPCCPEEVA